MKVNKAINSEGNRGAWLMKIQLTVSLEGDETSREAQIIAKLKDLGFSVSDGDADGRRWFLLNGRINESGLNNIVMEISD
jgi:hypothetical protein